MKYEDNCYYLRRYSKIKNDYWYKDCDIETTLQPGDMIYLMSLNRYENITLLSQHHDADHFTAIENKSGQIFDIVMIYDVSIERDIDCALPVVRNSVEELIKSWKDRGFNITIATLHECNLK